MGDVIFSNIEMTQLELMVQFLYRGEIVCTEQSILTEVISNLENFLGLPMKDVEIHSNNLIKEEILDEQFIKVEEESFENIAQW